ncbi:MAG TPA: tol-pal system-associated acyl-CoA thioesterase [Caldimonas sp.]|nr:tol-pal system-associated acyl-CoA thioesterase [Caldimonas sp.]
MTVARARHPADPATAFSLAVRVYWEDTDAVGVVFYANYLKFFERARTEWLRGLGFAQERMRAEAGIAFVVTETSVRYRLPARLDDLLDVTVQVVHRGLASLVVAQRASRAGEVLAEGTIRIGCIELGTFRPRRFPDDILTQLKALPQR